MTNVEINVDIFQTVCIVDFVLNVFAARANWKFFMQQSAKFIPKRHYKISPRECLSVNIDKNDKCIVRSWCSVFLQACSLYLSMCIVFVKFLTIKCSAVTAFHCQNLGSVSVDIQKKIPQFQKSVSFIEQDSLANAKLSTQQQCMYEGPQQRNLWQINARRIVGYNSVAIFIRCLLLPPKSARSHEIICLKIRTCSSSKSSKVICVGLQCQLKAHMRLPISH